MKFYTKEWYSLMQGMSYTDGFRIIPDKRYSEEEIRAFYEQDLAEEIARDQELHETPPDFSWTEELLTEEEFDPETFLFENEETGEVFHPATAEEVRAHFARQQADMEAQFAARGGFDPTETIDCFRECYQMRTKYAAFGFPEWVGQVVDPRVLALDRMPELAYERLQKEEQKNRQAFEEINEAAEVMLEAQNIPANIRDTFRFHDAHILAIKKVRHDVELTLKKDGAWPGGTPYTKVIFRKVWRYDREPGWHICPSAGDKGEWASNCQYLYDEIYRDPKGYEIHMMFWAADTLRYLTIGCEDIVIEDDIDWAPEKRKKNKSKPQSKSE